MKIEHIAIWVKDLEKMRSFYEKYFDAQSNDRYHNPIKQFYSYFLSFSSGSRLELMSRVDVVKEIDTNVGPYIGITHMAISVGSKDRVLTLTEEIRSAGYKVIGEPRTTGDGYFESVIADPEGNHIEITI